MLLKWLKRLKYVALVVLGLAIIIGVLVFLKCSCDEPSIARQGWKHADKEQTSTLFDKLNPLKTTPTKADKLLKGWPSGTRIVEVTPQEETVYIAVPPSGEIQVPEHVTGVTVYEKPTRDWGLEVRPFLGAGVNLPEPQPAAVAGVDILNIWRVHTGPGVCVDSGAFSGVWTASVNVWRNVGARGGIGYGTKGTVGVVAITIAIE